MALTELQARLCRLLAERRKASGESYVAGGVALNELLSGSRVSRDIDLFHDTEEALADSWTADRQAIEAAGFRLVAVRQRPGLVEAEVSDQRESVIVEWARDSAFRFFPLVEHEVFGLALHPFDLATNKVLALVGRLEVRDWIDVITCDRNLQPLGYLAWAASGKDPGFSPASILAHASRTGRYSREEIAALPFESPPPAASELAARWHTALERAREVVQTLPAEHAGTCVLGVDAALFRGNVADLQLALSERLIMFRRGSIRGVQPTVEPL